MTSKFLAVLGLCVAVSILTAAVAHAVILADEPICHHSSPPNYDMCNVKAKESSDYDCSHDDYEHKGYDDGYDCKGYGGDCDDYVYMGYSYDYKSYGDDCDDYSYDYYGHGNDYYGFDNGYGYYPDSSYAGGCGGGDGIYPSYYSYGGIYGYGYPGYGFPGYFGYESSAGVDAGTKKFDAMTEEGTSNSAEKKASKTPSKETKPKSDAASKAKTK